MAPSLFKSFAASLLVIISGTAPLTSRAAPPTPATNLAPDAALAELKAGNRRFVEGKSNACAETPPKRSELIKGQAPNAIILSCSDSRVPPEYIFDQELGKIFVIRVAGNVLDPIVIASIEYAVSNLGSRLILVLGHESCGAVKEALEPPEASDALSPNLHQLLSEIRGNLGKTAAAPGDRTIRGPVKKNVTAISGDLLRGSKIIAKAVSQGQVKIEDGIYGLGNGQVEFWEPSRGGAGR